MPINVGLLVNGDTEQLLLRLGGIKRVAAELGITTQAVSNWLARGGMPEKRCFEILRLMALANASGQQITFRPIVWDQRFKICCDYDIAA